MASAIISAVISTGIGYAIASSKAARDERGKRAHAARLAVAVADAVAEQRRQIREYQVGIRASVKRETDGPIHTDDLLWAGKVLTAAAGLPWWRHRLVNHRVRKLVGKALYEIADVHPDMDAGGALSLLLVTEYQNRERQRYRPEDFRGLLQSALVVDSTDEKIKKLLRQLNRLSAGR
jgi:hypothetical protein